MYDQDKDKIFHLYNLSVHLRRIIQTHIKHGKYASLKEYIDKRESQGFANLLDEKYPDLS